MKIFLNIFKLNLKIVYFLLKLLPTNNKKVLLMSRQTKTPSIDFLLVNEDIKKRYPKYKVVILNKMIESGIKRKLVYYFHIYKQMYHLATSKVCLIDTYIIPVSVLTHKKNLTIIQLCHGIGNLKKFGYQTLKKESGKNEKLSHTMDMHKNYDYIVSTSNETSKLLINSSSSLLFLVSESPKILILTDRFLFLRLLATIPVIILNNPSSS